MGIRKLFLLFAIIFIWSCNSDEVEQDMITVAIADTMSLSQFRNAVEVQGPKAISQAGKIYAYSDLIFINDSFAGVHIIDNSDPSSPTPVSYIKIPGNADISIKDNYLYADSAIDLLVFDISDINQLKLVERLENVFSIYDYAVPLEAEYVDYESIDFQNEIVVGWDLQERPRDEYEPNIGVDVFTLSESGDVGQGGSLARFQIVDDFLYTVGTSSMLIFNIESLSQPNLVNEQYAGWRIETMFYADQYLYLGGSNGMYIYDLFDPAAPAYVSEFTHWEGCDPIVVDGDYAYLTLRGGNECGQDESVLEVIDIKDKASPRLVSRYTMDNPYGLGYYNELLFICDGNAGLKVYNKTDPLNLDLIKTFDNVFAMDVIAQQNRLLLVGDNSLHQYAYANGDLQLLSTLILN